MYARKSLSGENFIDNREQLVAHARRHFREDYLTIPQVKALRKITGKTELLPVQPSHNSPNAASPAPGPSHVSNTVPDFQQTARSIHGNAGIEISITPTATEKYSMLELFDGKRQQISWNLETYLRR